MDITTITDTRGVSMTLIPTDEYNEVIKSLKNMEIRKNLLEKNYAELLLSVETHVEEIRLLKEEKLLLEKTIKELTDKLQKLIDNNELLINDNKIIKEENAILKKQVYDLTEDIKVFKTERDENKKLLKLSQCIYNYKEFQKQKITKKNYKFQRCDLFDILNGKYDDDLDDSQLSIKDKMNDKINNLFANNRKKNNGIQIFKDLIKSITIERNTLSHPVISNDELTEIKKEFLYTSNIQWPNDPLNNIVADEVFDELYAN
jgi:hypothetical protein